MREQIEEFPEQEWRHPTLALHWNVLKEVIETIGSLPAESGGAIGGNEDGTEVTHFHFDMTSGASAATYSPDHRLLNRLFKRDWNPRGVRLRGFVHSHPGHMNRPSHGDGIYAEEILKGIDDLEFLWLPIVNTVPETGQFRLTPWAAYRGRDGISIVRADIQVVDVPAEVTLEVKGESVFNAIQSGVICNEIVVGKLRSTVLTTVHSAASAERRPVPVAAGGKKVTIPVGNRSLPASFEGHDTFARVQSAYDLDIMRAGRVIAVGAGGAASWLEELARAGLGQFILIDPDRVSESNLATQQTYRKDIGRPKVECIAERIADINPAASIMALQKCLDHIGDEEFRRLAFDPIDDQKRKQTVICGLTDNFFAQARVNRLALQFGLPSLCAQVYKEGRAAEVTFTFPGVTPACHRCILSARYRHFLEQGGRNDVTSDGTPIFSTTRLNATKGFIALALLHHESDHPRWGKILTRVANRNLVQIRMDPDFAETMNMGVFNRVFEHADHARLFFDETVWLPQERECPATGYAACPDCGGTGDLRDAIGKFDDTRLVAPRDSKASPDGRKPHANVLRAQSAYRRIERLT